MKGSDKIKKCECWEEEYQIIGWYNPYVPELSEEPIQICNGTKEREICSCNGDVTKCEFYPEKRKENNIMNTAEMWLNAQEDGKIYYCNSVKYQKDIGLINVATEKPWPLGAWTSLDKLMKEEWERYQTMTKSEAEAKFNIKIVGE